MPSRIKLVFYIAILLIISGRYSFAGQIAITIDDAPKSDSIIYTGNDRIKTIVDKLSRLNIPEVMIFATGKNISRKQGWERLRLYADKGHLIANHSYEHFDLNKVTAAEFGGDILKNHELIKDLPTFSRFFRYPFLHEGKTTAQREYIRNFLKEQRLANGYVTIDNWDWYICLLMIEAKKKQRPINFENLKKLYIDHIWSAIRFYDQLAVEYLGRSPKHVLLLHDIDTTALFIDGLVEYIRQKDWEIISPVNAYQDPIADYWPKTLINNQGRVMAMAIDKGYKGPHDSGEDAESIKIESI